MQNLSDRIAPIARYFFGIVKRMAEMVEITNPFYHFVCFKDPTSLPNSGSGGYLPMGTIVAAVWRENELNMKGIRQMPSELSDVTVIIVESPAAFDQLEQAARATFLAEKLGADAVIVANEAYLYNVDLAVQNGMPAQFAKTNPDLRYAPGQLETLQEHAPKVEALIVHAFAPNAQVIGMISEVIHRVPGEGTRFSDHLDCFSENEVTVRGTMIAPWAKKTENA